MSIALYGYRDQLNLGLHADATAMSEFDPVCEMLKSALSDLSELPAIS